MAVLGTATRARSRATGSPRTSRRELRIVIEPAVPERYYWPVRDGRPQKLERAQFVDGFAATSARRTSSTAARCGPTCSTATAAQGYCMVMTMGLIRGRAEAAERRAALAYYARLERESDVVFAVSPFAPTRSRSRSTSTSPTATTRPPTSGPVPTSRIYRLRDCEQRYGPLQRSMTVHEDTGPAAAPGAQPLAGRPRRRRDRPPHRAGAAGGDPARRARAAALVHRPRAAVRVTTPTRTSISSRGGARCSRGGLQPALLREPAGAHVPALRDLQGPLHRGFPFGGGATSCAASRPIPRPRS